MRYYGMYNNESSDRMKEITKRLMAISSLEKRSKSPNIYRETKNKLRKEIAELRKGY